jgi:hypothetical protein
VKAQISFVEFIVTFSIFSVFVAYLFFRLLSFMPAYLNEIRSERVRSEAYQISELLVNDPGEPISFNQGGPPPADIKRYGLSHIANKTNFLDMGKVARFLDDCDADYERTRKKIGTDFQFSVSFNAQNGIPSSTTSCGPPQVITRAINATVRRLVAFSPEDSGNYGELIVNVW